MATPTISLMPEISRLASFRVLTLAAITCVSGISYSASPDEHTASQLVDIDGVIHQPFDDSSVRAVVLAFVITDCPIANSYAPELNRLHADYDKRGVRIFVIQVDPDLAADDARRHAKEYELHPPVVLDNQHVWVEMVGATVTPEVAVLSPKEKVLYVGRIDDRYAALGKRREQPTSHDLRETIDAILAGRAVPRSKTKAIGCHIPELQKEK